MVPTNSTEGCGALQRRERHERDPCCRCEAQGFVACIGCVCSTTQMIQCPGLATGDAATLRRDAGHPFARRILLRASGSLRSWEASPMAGGCSDMSHGIHPSSVRVPPPHALAACCPNSSPVNFSRVRCCRWLCEQATSHKILPNRTTSRRHRVRGLRI